MTVLDPGERLRASIPGATTCRFCSAPLELSVVDLGMSPLCQTVVRPDALEQSEPFYPLHVRACEQCWLLQIGEFVPPTELFTEYAYFSAYSTSWVEHARRYVETMVERQGLGPESFVVELASNDGYLLQHFLPKGIPVLGIEPAANVAEAAVDRGVPTLTEFFGHDLAEGLVADGPRADLIVGNNVLAQVPDINDFAAGVQTLLAPGGIATFEVPHVARLLESVQYDTIYHEHFSYFSVFTLARIFGGHGLALVDVEELASHGGSIRAFFAHVEEERMPSAAVGEIIGREQAAGLRTAETYRRFAEQVRESKRAPARRARRPAPRRQAGCRLRGARQGEHPAQLLRHPHRLPRLHRGSQSLQARQLHAGDAHPDLFTGAARGDPPGRDRHPAVEPRSRDQCATVVHREVGRVAPRAGPPPADVRAGRETRHVSRATTAARVSRSATRASRMRAPV